MFNLPFPAPVYEYEWNLPIVLVLAGIFLKPEWGTAACSQPRMGAMRYSRYGALDRNYCRPSLQWQPYGREF